LSEHSNEEPASSELKVKFAVVSAVLAAGPDSIVVSGAVLSGGSTTVQLWAAGVASVLPAASVARTLNVWSPSASPS
jgi:hypothetical protein